MKATLQKTPLRVLHIGNIANNAYNNARILRRANVESDVICADEYDAMGCAEWEDANFTEPVKSTVRPRWYEMDLGGFERPRWFVQGPLELCLRYLLARKRGQKVQAEKLWHQLSLVNMTRRPRGTEFILRGWLSAKGRICDLLWGAMSPIRVAWKLDSVQSRLRTSNSLDSRLLNVLIRYSRGFFEVLSSRMAPAVCLKLLKASTARRVKQRLESLTEAFEARFNSREDKLLSSDVLAFCRQYDLWEALFEHYDIVQAYAIEPIVPMLVGHPYLAFEHGTLRRIPSLPNAAGRATSLSYHLAEHVLVTNSDCLENAEHLAPDRVTFINHPLEIDQGGKLHGVDSYRRALCSSLDADFLFFFPTRHDWVKGAGYADKANDVFIRAFADLRRKGYRVGVVCCAWGHNVIQSKELFCAFSCDKYVKWTSPMGVRQYEVCAAASDIVVDQFLLGAFGGVTLKALSVGAVVCTYLDAARVIKTFKEVPPVINCRTREEIIGSCEPLIRDRGRLKALSRASREWVEKFHATDATVDAQCRVYAELLEERKTGRVSEALAG